MLNTESNQKSFSDEEISNKNSIPANKRYTIVSYFSGCGGLDLGFRGNFNYKGEELEKLPFDIIAAYDKDEKCVETYNKYFGEHAEVETLTEDFALNVPKADILIGGFPCQDFSSCGPKAGLTTERGRSYLSLISYMKTHKPSVVVAENVPHLEKMKGGSVVKKIHDDFVAAGYRFVRWKLHGVDYGIPQKRSRVFFIGVRNDISGHPIEPAKTHKENHLSIDWAIEDLEKVLDETIPNQSQYFKANKAKTGNGQGDEKNKKGEPSYTIRANAKSRVQFHYSLERRLTVRECARLQTFPDDFVFPHSATTNIMQIGNAVPPLLGYQVALSIAAFLNALK